jgi:hypothetical protein
VIPIPSSWAKAAAELKKKKFLRHRPDTQQKRICTTAASGGITRYRRKKGSIVYLGFCKATDLLHVQHVCLSASMPGGLIALAALRRDHNILEQGRNDPLL